MTLTGFHEERHYTKAELSCLNDFDIHELLRKNILIGIEESKYKFGFVGVVSNSVSAFCVLPKIWKNTPIIPSQIDDTIASLNQYKKSNRIKHIGIDYFKTDPADPECSELAIAKFLINDYKKHGIYIVNEAITELNGNGDIDWPLTIGNLDPVYSQGQPIYSDTINHVIIDDREHLTVEIHKWSIAYVAKKYAHLLNQGNLLQTNVVLPIETLGPKKQLIKHLIKELNITYTDRGIRLLKSLIFLLGKKTPGLINNLSLFGTRKYELIWEDICKKLTHDHYDSLTPAEKSKFFPNPQWSVLANDIWEKNKTHIPDILSKDISTGQYYLFDAKYYLIKYDNNKISDEPGYHDILKQFLYQQHLEVTLKNIKNALLLPILDNEFISLEKKGVIHYNSNRAVIGSIEYELFKGKKLYVIMCPFSKWQKMYNKSESLDFSEIDWSE